MITREQQRAEGAYDRVSAVSTGRWTGDQKENYGRQCLHLPVLIQQCGLCQALTFLQAKGANQRDKPEFHQLLIDLAEVAKIPEDAPRDVARLTDAVRGSDGSGVTRYQWMTREALACAVWFKRYAEAVLKVEPGSEKGSQR